MKPFHLIILILLLISCFKEDKKIAIVPIQKTTVNITGTSNYQYQAYFSLKENKIMAQNTKTDWDLAFECTSKGWHIRINTAKAMFVKNTLSTDFNLSYTTDNVNAYDMPTGNLDSTTIGNWGILNGNLFNSYNNVYILDRGKDLNSISIGFKKINFTGLNNDTYSFTYSDIDGSNKNTYSIKKDSAYNFVYFSFDNGGQTIAIEPPKNNWDLLFTQYYQFVCQYGICIPYPVTGVLTNPTRIVVAMDTIHSFASLTNTNLSSYQFNNRMNSIGFNWKYLISGGYAIHSQYNYITKDNSGNYYKLHFVGYYDKTTGKEGAIQFEYKPL